MTRLTVGCVSLLALAGCAGNQEVPPETFARAQASIEQAEQADAQRYASMELNTARNKLQMAQDAAQEGDEEVAVRLAEQAALDAELASATAQNQETQAAVAELRASIQTLQQELERQSQAAPR